MLLRPGLKAHVTSTPPPPTPAWPPTAPRARCTPPTTARSTGPAPVGRQDLGHRRRPARRVAVPGCGRIRPRVRAGRVLRQHVLLDHHHLRPIPPTQHTPPA